MTKLFILKWAILFSVSLCAYAKRTEHWSYHEKGGPAGWATLSPDYSLCASGKNQSPVDIVPSPSRVSEKWELHYGTTALYISHNEHMEELIDNGHTIQITPEPGSYITFKGKDFQLKQFHFHTPSEHSVNGKQFPMEVHFVHQSENKKFVVIGVMVEEGKSNSNFKQLIKSLPDAKGEKKTDFKIRFNPQSFLSKDLLAYHYSGSLTTPPCVEGVEWLVLKDHIRMSKEQIAEFSRRLKNNNRPVQAINSRKILNSDIVIRN